MKKRSSQRRGRGDRREDQIIDLDHAREERRRKRQATLEKKQRKQTVPHTTEGRKRVSARAARRRALLLLFLVVALTLTGVSAFHIYNLKKQEAAAEQLKADLVEQLQTLEDELSQTNSPEYIEQQAREQLKMVDPGEVLYVMPNQNQGDGQSGQAGEDPAETTKSGILP